MSAIRSRVCEFDVIEHSFQELTLDDLKIDFEQQQKIYWVHCDLSRSEELQQIAKKLHLPDHVLEWCNQIDKTPKLVDDDVSLTMQVECLGSVTAGDDEDYSNKEIEFESLIVYLTPNFCFTASLEAIPALLLFINRYPKALRYAKTSCFILFLLLDNIINDYSKILLNFQGISDQIDLRVREVKENIYDNVMLVKKQVMKAKRYISAIRDTLMRISARKIPVISRECRLSLRNLFNHSQMIFVQFDSVRDTLNSTLDQIDNSLMQKMNSTMKILTAFAAIFLPMTLIAGIYGMNFKMPEYNWHYGYLWPLALMALCGILLVWIFKKKRWF